MDKYTQERIDMITGMIMVITNMNETDVKDLIGTTVIYKNIIGGEECTLYEDYSANLMSIVKELKRKNVESDICKITSDEVSDLNQQMFSQGIRTADELKKNLYKGQTVEVKSTVYVPNRRMLKFSSYFKFFRGKENVPTYEVLGNQRRKYVMPYSVVACKAGKGLGIDHNRPKRAAASSRIKSSVRTKKKGFGPGRVR